jgi:hypothetical protein
VIDSSLVVLVELVFKSGFLVSVLTLFNASKPTSKPKKNSAHYMIYILYMSANVDQWLLLSLIDDVASDLKVAINSSYDATLFQKLDQSPPAPVVPASHLLPSCGILLPKERPSGDEYSSNN